MVGCTGVCACSMAPAIESHASRYTCCAPAIFLLRRRPLDHMCPSIFGRWRRLPSGVPRLRPSPANPLARPRSARGASPSPPACRRLSAPAARCQRATRSTAAQRARTARMERSPDASHPDWLCGGPRATDPLLRVFALAGSANTKLVQRQARQRGGREKVRENSRAKIYSVQALHNLLARVRVRGPPRVVPREPSLSSLLSPLSSLSV